MLAGGDGWWPRAGAGETVQFMLPGGGRVTGWSPDAQKTQRGLLHPEKAGRGVLVPRTR